MSLRYLGITGSLRQKSTNQGLLRTDQANLPAGVDMECANLSEIPFYNADITEKPASVRRGLDQIGGADVLVLACPEYDYSLAPALKNILAWGPPASPTTHCSPAKRSPSWALEAGWAPRAAPLDTPLRGHQR